LIDDILAKEPELCVAGQVLRGAWDDLETCRQIGYSLGPIPWDVVSDWCQRHQLDHDVSLMVIHVIRYLDVSEARRRESERKVKAPRSKGGDR
jgi:hypothetical protein